MTFEQIATMKSRIKRLENEVGLESSDPDDECDSELPSFRNDILSLCRESDTALTELHQFRAARKEALKCECRPQDPGCDHCQEALRLLREMGK